MLAHVFVVVLTLLLDPVVVIEVGPSRFRSLFSFFPAVVGLLPLLVASCVWMDLCCLLTWCLPAQICLLSGLGRQRRWLASTPTIHTADFVVLSSKFSLWHFQLLDVFLY